MALRNAAACGPQHENPLTAWLLPEFHVFVYRGVFVTPAVMVHCSMTNIDQNPTVATSAPTDQVNLRSEPPLVYLEPNTQDHWIVEPPRDAVGDKDARVFTGHHAQYAALVHAYETFGSARFIPY